MPKPFVDLVRSVEPAVAELEVADTEAGQAERGQAAEDGDGVVLRLVDVLVGERPSWIFLIWRGPLLRLQGSRA